MNIRIEHEGKVLLNLDLDLTNLVKAQNLQDVVPINCLTVEHINTKMVAYAQKVFVDLIELKSANRKIRFTTPRQAFILSLIENYPKTKQTTIAKAFNKNHTTITHSIKTAKNLLESNDALFLKYYKASNILFNEKNTIICQ